MKSKLIMFMVFSIAFSANAQEAPKTAQEQLLSLYANLNVSLARSLDTANSRIEELAKQVDDKNKELEEIKKSSNAKGGE